MLGNPADALHLGHPTYTRGRPTYTSGTHPAPTPASASSSSASARSNSIDSFGSNNSVICRYYSISRGGVCQVQGARGVPQHCGASSLSPTGSSTTSAESP